MGRYASGHGHGMGGTDKHSRQGGMATGMLSTMEKGIVAKEEKNEMQRRLGKVEPPEPAKPPMADDGALGSKVVHRGQHGAPDIYREKDGGRRGMRGKRGA